MWRSMVNEDYDPDYAAALSAASAAVGPIIPPSIPMIVAGSMVDVSVARLFMECTHLPSKQQHSPKGSGSGGS